MPVKRSTAADSKWKIRRARRALALALDPDLNLNPLVTVKSERESKSEIKSRIKRTRVLDPPVLPPVPSASHLTRAREVFDIELAAVKAVRAQLNDSFARSVELTVEVLFGLRTFSIMFTDSAVGFALET